MESVVQLLYKIETEEELPPYLAKTRLELTVHGVVDFNLLTANLLSQAIDEELSPQDTALFLQAGQQAVRDYLVHFFRSFDPSKLDPDQIKVTVLGEIQG